ncbi:MAG: hypothetical protein QXI16_07440 [Sulfolobaceae archaeon]
MSEVEALAQIDEMQKVGQDIEALESQQTEEESVSHVTPHMLATALQPLTRMLARKTGIKAIELTDEDVKDLELALQPLNLAVLEKVSKYLPITIFAVGYLLRIFMELWEKRKEKKQKETEEEKQKVIPIYNNEKQTNEDVYVVPPLPKREELNPQNPKVGAEVEEKKEEKKTDESPKSDKAGT